MDNVRRLPLTNGCFALVDSDDWERVQGYRWRLLRARSGQLYAQAKFTENGTRHTVLLHRLLLGAERGQVVDHINSDGLDNRRGNLRLCGQRDNLRHITRSRRQRRGGLKGVKFDKRRGTWSASIRCGEPDARGFSRSQFLGSFSTEEQAARAYDEASRALFGEYAAPNFGSEQEPVVGRRLRGPGNYHCSRCGEVGHTSRSLSCRVRATEPVAVESPANASEKESA